jgi:carbon monoxide dehydrogenase subunit G
MQIDGKGALGYTRGSATVELQEEAGNRTLMRYRSDVQVGGRIAAVGQRLLDSVARMMMRQALDALETELKARLNEGDRRS